MSTDLAHFAAPSHAALRTRVRATIAAVAFLPACALIGFLTLFSDRASGCVIQGGEQCVGMPGWVWLCSALAAGALWGVALFTPDRGERTDALRKGAFRAQLGFEALALFAIVSYA
ncbi:hypothetical protein [Streptomyces sp. CB03238]|uniref:hypothetical protein n=1 Tax=Streptomyces sp. CB03238 TaxID=1907777 RepID=UPI000A111B57|nr:hypothetical protein [Streptomyces sp. CB03238]ORT61670.1 hypothetical protein BKD26_01150 [Streptomyces sp. CB03238]